MLEVESYVHPHKFSHTCLYLVFSEATQEIDSVQS